MSISRCYWCEKVQKIDHIVHPHANGFSIAQYIMKCDDCGINHSHCRINSEAFIDKYNSLVDRFNELTQVPDASIEITEGI